MWAARCVGVEGRGGVKKAERFILLPSLHSLLSFCQFLIHHSTVGAKMAALYLVI